MTSHIEDRMTRHPGGQGQNPNVHPRPKPEWKRVPWWWPARWFGYKWAQLYETHSPGSYMRYRTDKQMADEVLAQLKPATQAKFDSAGYGRIA